VPVLEYHYDFSCPYAYLASTQVRALASRTGASLDYRPFLLGGVFRAVGYPGMPLDESSPHRIRMNDLDMRRWAEHWGVPLVRPPTHPNRTVLALRATLASTDVPAATHALFSAYWARGEDVSSPDVVRAALDGAGLDGAALVARAEDPAIKDELRRRTDEAVARGVFGAPTFFVGSELYWGQDRMHLVERELRRVSQPAGKASTP
jgi:2-hydroxychromene-2-carboxylate isomerase